MSFIPLLMMLQTPPRENARLNAVPSSPRPQFRYQLKLNFSGLARPKGTKNS